MKVGRRLATKVLNVSRFVLSRLPEKCPGDDAITAAVDRSMLVALARVVGDATAAFEAYDYTRALERTERFFWRFCDDYVELVKGRAYGAQGDTGARSAQAALAWALDSLLGLLAPFLPFVTEEVWSWSHDGSIHRTAWPDPWCLASAAGDGDPLVLEVAASALGEVRKAKTAAKRSLRSEVATVVVTGTGARLDALRPAAGDLKEAGRIARLDLVEGEAPFVAVELAPE
jgi:valyl-tRNA synthetase